MENGRSLFNTPSSPLVPGDSLPASPLAVSARVIAQEGVVSTDAVQHLLPPLDTRFQKKRRRSPTFRALHPSNGPF